MRLYNKIRNKLHNTFGSPVVVPGYDVKRAVINEYRERYGLEMLIETGTFLGDTVEHFRNVFKKIISIELAADLAAKAQSRFAGHTNITIIQGDSAVILNDLLKDLHKPVLFWLDGHYSSEFYMGDEFIRTARTDKDTPIKEELMAILTAKPDHILLIDDARLFNGTSDYPTIGEIKKMVKRLRSNYAVIAANDIIRIIPSRS